MAETNFSGPVNSEAGFLSGPFTVATAPTDPTTGQLAYFSDHDGSATWGQWDGSAWVAVGGGGSSAVLAVPGETTTLTFTSLGQVITVVNGNANSEDSISINVAPIENIDAYVVNGGYFNYAGSFVNLSGDMPLSNCVINSCLLQICFSQILVVEGDNVAVFTISGTGYGVPV